MIPGAKYTQSTTADWHWNGVGPGPLPFRSTGSIWGSYPLLKAKGEVQRRLLRLKSTPEQQCSYGWKTDLVLPNKSRPSCRQKDIFEVLYSFLCPPVD